MPGSGVLAWIGHVLGYALVAVVVGYVNAMLVAVLGHVRIAVPRFSRVTASSNRGEPLPPRTLMSRSRFALQPSRPRAPPLRVGRGADPTRQVCSPLGMRGSWRFMDIPMEIDDETASTLGLGHLGVFRCARVEKRSRKSHPFGAPLWWNNCDGAFAFANWAEPPGLNPPDDSTHWQSSYLTPDSWTFQVSGQQVTMTLDNVKIQTNCKDLYIRVEGTTTNGQARRRLRLREITSGRATRAFRARHRRRSTEARGHFSWTRRCIRNLMTWC